MNRCKTASIHTSLRLFTIAAVALPALFLSATAYGQTADLVVEQTVAVEEIACGDLVTITMTVTNNGPDTATSITATNVLPACSPFNTFISITQGSGVFNMGTITANFGTLNVDQSATLVFRVTVSDECTPFYENEVNVTSAVMDPNPDNNQSILRERVGCGDLTVEKTGLTEAVCSGTIVYQLIAQQTGPGAAGDVVVTDQLPACLTDVVCLTPQGSCTVDENNLLTAELGTIGADESVTIAVAATVTDDCAPSISNSATISTPAAEPDTTNNTSNPLETDIICLTGACCLADAPCEELTIAGCAAAGGAFEGLDTTCAASDSDGDGRCDAFDGCPDDANKTEPGECGCGVADTDTDGDGTPDCNDGCPNDANKTEPGECGCGEAETDTDGDGIPDCVDNCPDVANADQADEDNDGIGDACEEAGNGDACGLVCGPGTMPLIPLMVVGWWSMKRRRHRSRRAA